MSARAEGLSARTERAVLRNLLAETLAAYEAELGSPAAAPAGNRDGVAEPPRRPRPALGSRRFGMADVKAENGILRRLLKATNQAYEEGLDALQAERSLAGQLLAAVAAAVLVTDAAGTVTRVNGAAEELTGWSAPAARGRALGEVLRIVGAEGRRVALDLAPCLDGGQQMVMRRSLQALDRDGRARAVTGRVTPLRGRRREVLGAVLVLRVIDG